VKKALVGLMVLAGLVLATMGEPTWAETMGYRKPPPVPPQTPAVPRFQPPRVIPEFPGNWIPGQWVWRRALRRYVWIHGYWARKPGPAFIWIPGQWVWRPQRGIYVWVSGHWEKKPPRRVWVPQPRGNPRNEWPRARQPRKWN